MHILEKKYLLIVSRSGSHVHGCLVGMSLVIYSRLRSQITLKNTCLLGFPTRYLDIFMCSRAATILGTNLVPANRRKTLSPFTSGDYLANIECIGE